MDIYMIMTEGYTDCALAEAVLQKYMGYCQYRAKGDMPVCLQKLVGVYPGELGELEPKDMPHFYHKGESAVMVKTAKGFSEIAKKLVLVMDAVLSAGDDDSAVKGVFIICDADLSPGMSNWQKLEADLEIMDGVELDREKGRISYEGLDLCYKIHQIPQKGEGAVEKLLLGMLGKIEPGLAECAGNYRSQIMDERFERLHRSWAKDRKVQEFYADKVQLGAALAVLKPDRPVGYAVKDCLVDSKKKQELMEIEEFQSLYQRLNDWLGEEAEQRTR
ncbi:MAG: hypothetical protein J6K53_11935 [Roseburia sp.]|nr:hypothetical protein [Roseburia sp.]